MPEIDQTFERTCGADWTAVAGGGRVFVENQEPSAVLLWAIGDATAPTIDTGYRLPAFHSSRSGAEAIVVPAGKRLWIRSGDRSATAHPVLLTVAAAP